MPIKLTVATLLLLASAGTAQKPERDMWKGLLALL
jgi:hypothetical protein